MAYKSIIYFLLRWKTAVATKLEKVRNPAQRDTRAGFSLTVSKVPEDIISVIKQTASTLRPSEKRVAEVILADVNFALHSANGELARRAGVSEPTVTRFSRAIGCAGVRELKVKLAQSLVVGRILSGRAAACR